MADRDFERVENVFHAALDLPVADRDAFIKQACNGDEGLMAEVSSLLSSVENSNGFMGQPALTAAFSVLINSPQESLLGKSLGAYRIISSLGKGGMGDVYLAEDTRLNRKLALKFLSMELLSDNWAKRQLLKEAQSVAMLDHPNICQVYGIEDHGERSFIAMQYVAGTTLADLMQKKKLSIDEVLSLAKQIVGALAEAHAHGIIHRDIKPRNIMVTPNQLVKVLDFGLAKTVQRIKGREVTEDSISNLAGVCAGTIPYMSPEQLREEKLDYRSDVFSVGIVLYEMLTGKNPFARDNNAETITAILSEKPRPLEQSGNQVKDLDRIVQKCLEKNSEDRYQSASDLLIDLDVVAGAYSTAESRRKLIGKNVVTRRVSRVAVMVAVIALVCFVSYFIYAHLTRPKVVAVLPIQNISGDPALNYLGDGLTDTITTKLSRLSKLSVQPPTLVQYYKGKTVDPKQISEDLAADGVLIGTISGTTQFPVLHVKLVMKGTDGLARWEQQYPVDLSNVFALEADISRNITSKMELVSAEDERLVKELVGPANPAARKHHWLGQYYWKTRGDNKKTLDDAIREFKEAIALEPTYAEAWAGLADCYAYWNVVAYGQADTIEAMNMAVRAAKEAIELNPNLPQAHTSLATVYMKYYWDWNEAEQQFKLAIALDRNYAPAHYGYSRLLTIRARNEEAIAEGRLARDLDPFSASTILNYCRTLFFAERFEDSVRCYDKLVEDHPDYKTGRYVRSWVYFHLGRYNEAIATLEDLYAQDKRLAGAALGYAYGQRGRKADAERILQEMLPFTKDNLPPQEIALIYFGIGEMENARIWFEESAKAHFAPFAFLLVDPMFKNLRAEAWFMNLAKKYEAPFPH